MIPGVALLIGIAVAVLSWRAWTGRWRTWARWPLWSTMPLHLYPAIALLFLGYALDELLFAGGSAAVWATVIGPIMFGTGTYLLAALFDIEPRWATPRWFHDTDRSPDVREATTAILALLAPRQDDQRGDQVLRNHFGPDGPLVRWESYLITDLRGASPKDHALMVPGQVEGRLELHPSGLGFRAVSGDDKMRQRPIAFALPRDEVLGVGTVPHGCDGRGVWHPPASLLRAFERGPYRRLVLRTVLYGDILLRTIRSRDRADRIAETLDIHRLPDLDRIDPDTPEADA